jgi:hypothetical protein
MIPITENQPKESLYEYRGKQFKCDQWTIDQLNRALALNHSTERYEKVNNKRTTKKS